MQTGMNLQKQDHVDETIHANVLSINHVAAGQCRKLCRIRTRLRLMYASNIKMGEIAISETFTAVARLLMPDRLVQGR